MYQPRPRAAFAAADNPIGKAFGVRDRYRTERRERGFVADKPAGSGNVRQNLPPHTEVNGILCCCAEPDVDITISPISGKHLGDVLRPLGQNLPIQLRRFRDEIKKIVTPRLRHSVVEHVSERSTKNAATAPPVLHSKFRCSRIHLREEGGVRLVAAYDMPAKFYEVQARAATEPAPGGPLEGALKTKRAVQIPDFAATDTYRQGHPRAVDAVELGRIRTVVAVPMLKDDQPIGVIAIHRPEVALFDEKQIALLTSFAAQAVIAIENARLLNELRQRTDDLSQRTTDLTEALEQQTATSEVLRVISISPGNLKPVLDTMLANGA
jgi:GAF domain